MLQFIWLLGFWKFDQEPAKCPFWSVTLSRSRDAGDSVCVKNNLAQVCHRCGQGSPGCVITQVSAILGGAPC